MRYIQYYLLICVLVSGMPVGIAHATAPAINASGVLAYTNAQRYWNNTPLLRSDAKLSSVAETKMRDLFARQYFAHESPTGESVSDLVDNVGYKYLAVGENLALGDFGNSKGVVEAWMDSPGHRENILSGTYSEIGIAVGRSNYEGRNTWIIVQSFGLPRSSCPTLDNVLGYAIDSLDRQLKMLLAVVELRESRVSEGGSSRSEKNARIESYNMAAELYNIKLEKYRDMVEQYNGGVELYNDCINNKVATVSH